MLLVNLNRVQTFSTSSAPQYFDGEQGRFRDTITYNISCYEIDVKNADGVSLDLVSTLNDLRLTEDYSTVFMASASLKNVKLLDFSIEEGPFTDYGLATLTFEKYGSRATNQMDGDLYNCFNQTIGSEPYQTYFEEFSEGFDFSEGKDSTSFSYTLDIKLREQAGDSRVGMLFPVNVPFLQNINGNTQIKLAREFAKNIFQCADRPTIPVLPPSISGIYESGYKKTYRENIDLINNTCSFTENFQTTNIESGGLNPYSLVVTEQVARDERGVLGLSENGKIEGLGTNFSPQSKYVCAEAGLVRELGAATGRLYTLFTRVSGAGDYPINTGCDGGVRLFSQETTKNSFDGSIEYTVTANNDPKFSGLCSGGSFFVQDTFSSEEANYSGAQRVLNIEGWGVGISGQTDGASVSYPRFEKAQELLTGAQWGDGISSLYRIYKTGDKQLNGFAPLPISENWDYDKQNGVIGVTFGYSSKPIYALNSASSGIKKLEVSYGQENKRPRANTFQALNLGVGAQAPDQLIQNTDYYTPQALNTAVNIVSSRATDFLSPTTNPRLSGLLQVASGQVFKDDVLGLKDKRSTYVVQNASYNYSPLNNVTLDLTVGFVDASGDEITFN